MVIQLDTGEFISLLKNPTLLKGYALQDLMQQAEEYPYAQALHALIAKKAHLDNDHDYERLLNKAAIRSIDRKILYHLINHQVDVERATSGSKNTSVDRLDSEITAKKAVAEKIDSKAKTVVKPKSKPKAPGTKKPQLQNIEKQQFDSNKNIQIKDGDIQDKHVTPGKRKKNIAAEFKEADKTQDLHGKHTFTDWLKQIKVKPSEEELQIISPEVGFEAKFIKESVSSFQGSKPVKEKDVHIQMESKKPFTLEEEQAISSLAANSIARNNENVTETLASLYTIQKKYDKAIEAYEILILKFPDKKPYFAKKIEQLKSN